VNGNDEISGRSTVDFDIEAGMANVRTRNVVGYIRGIQKPDSFLVVTAHYDHLGQMGEEVIFPGANDNASGVAMLLSLAKHFASSPPQYSMVFIALSAEETGLQGAGYFVSNPLIDLKKIRFLVNFDLAGTGEEGIKVVNGSVYKDNFDLLKKINDEKHYLKSVQSRGAACNSDHCIFYEQGVPCFYIYTLGGIQAYHDIYDRAETLPLTEFNDYTQLMIDFLGSL
jgi:Zn-dependent M28 family amino/carboxypeptidase